MSIVEAYDVRTRTRTDVAGPDVYRLLARRGDDLALAYLDRHPHLRHDDDADA